MITVSNFCFFSGKHQKYNFLCCSQVPRSQSLYCSYKINRLIRIEQTIFFIFILEKQISLRLLAEKISACLQCQAYY